MYIGVQALRPLDIRKFSAKHARKHKDLGFQAIEARFLNPENITFDDLKKLKEILDSHDLKTGKINGAYNDLVLDSEELRKIGIKTFGLLCQFGRFLETDTVYVRPGSLSPDGSWFAHEKNRNVEIENRLIQSLKEVCRQAESFGVNLALEGHMLSPLYSPKQIKRVIESVGSSVLGFNMDPVNFIGTLEEAFDPTSVVNELFDELGPYIVGAHFKDYKIDNKLVFHVEETVLGSGLMDQVTYLKRFNEICSDKFLLIEHLDDIEVPDAKKYLDKIALELNIKWENSEGA